jgi:microcystin-dependent protein
MDLAVATVPAWITNSTVKPYLLCDGTVYTATTVYGIGNPAPLLNLLGSTFGGNGITTFGVPDLQARVRIPLGGASGRVTTGGSGIDGTTINSGGGGQNKTIATGNVPALAFVGLQQTWNLNTDNSEPPIVQGAAGATYIIQFGSGVAAHATSTFNTTVTPSGSVNAGSPNTAIQIMQPTLVSGLTFIKT